MIDRLDELNEYKYYFQFTLNAYGQEIERGLPSKGQELIDTFRRLSDRIGSDKVIWRYDPIFLSRKYTMGYHEEYFGKLAERLRGYTKQCTFSYLDAYPKRASQFRKHDLNIPSGEERIKIAKWISNTGKTQGMKVVTCAEAIDLESFGIQHGSCIDKELIERLVGGRIRVQKDRNQRGECGCVESIDVGLYDTCLNLCQYCYANHGDETVEKQVGKYDPDSPLLCSAVVEGDRVYTRKVKSLRMK